MNNVDCYQVMAMCAVHTKKIRFGTAVTNMVYRDPTITANSFATLNEISQGRAIIGMGTGDGPVYSLGRTATQLVDFEKGLRVIHDLLHDRGLTVPKSKERAGGCARAWPIARIIIFASRWKPFPKAKRWESGASWTTSISRNR